MANTYQDTIGKYFSTQAEGAASNTAMGTNLSNTIPTSTLQAGSSPLNFPPPTIPTYGGIEGSINGAISVGNSQAEAEKVAQEGKMKNSTPEVSRVEHLRGG